MALSDDIRALRGRVLAELSAAHDYYADTKQAWEIVTRAVHAGAVFAARNTVTGSVTTQADLLQRAQGYVSEQLAQATFQQFLAIFESFFFDLLRLWLVAYPRNLSRKAVDFKSILDAPDKDAIILLAVNKELNEVLYEGPANWFAYLEDLAKLGCPPHDEIGRVAEAKATRDVLIHNRGVAGKVYESKAGPLARYKDGERIDVPEPYHRATWELLRKVVADVADAAAAKAP